MVHSPYTGLARISYSTFEERLEIGQNRRPARTKCGAPVHEGLAGRRVIRTLRVTKLNGSW